MEDFLFLVLQDYSLYGEEKDRAGTNVSQEIRE